MDREIWNFKEKELEVKQNPISRIIEIEGIRYGYEFFRNLAGIGECGFGLNEPFKITERKDGMITVEKVK